MLLGRDHHRHRFLLILGDSNHHMAQETATLGGHGNSFARHGVADGEGDAIRAVRVNQTLGHGNDGVGAASVMTDLQPAGAVFGERECGLLTEVARHAVRVDGHSDHRRDGGPVRTERIFEEAVEEARLLPQLLFVGYVLERAAAALRRMGAGGRDPVR